MQNAIDEMSAGGLMFIKQGTYQLSNPSVGVRMVGLQGPQHNGITIMGEGYGTVLEMKENGEVFEIDDVVGGSISNIRFEGERYDDENHAIVVRDSMMYTVNNNWFHNIGDEAINYGRVNQSSIFNNFFNHSTGAGGGGAISLQASNTTIISLNNLYNPSRNGIHIEQTASTKANHELTISNNVIVNSSWYGIVLTSTGFENRNNTDITIVGNVIEDAGKEGIRLAGSTGSTPKNIVVVGNVVKGGGNHPDGNQRGGIIVTQKIDPSNTVAVGNTVLDYGIESANRRGITGFDVYVGNTVVGSGDHGFFVGSNEVVVGNQCDDNGRSGAGQRAGISAQGDNNIIVGNTCQNNNLDDLVQQRGIQVASTGTGNIVIGNNVMNGGNNKANWLDDDGTNSTVIYNIGEANKGTQTVVKTVEEIVNNSAAVQDDDELSLWVYADTYYFVDVNALVQSSNVADFDMILSTPSGSDGNCYEADNTDGTNAIADTTEAGSNQNNSNRFSFLRCVIETGSVDGFITLQWAQRTAEATDTKVKERSYMTITYLGDA
jgi:hypothetical protein